MLTLKKLLSLILVLILTTQASNCAEIRSKRRQKNNLKKIALVLTIGAAVTAGTAVAFANYAPEYYPDVLKQVTPDFLLWNHESKENKKNKNLNDDNNDLDSQNDSTDWDLERIKEDVTALFPDHSENKENLIYNLEQIQSYKNHLISKQEASIANYADFNRHIKDALFYHNKLVKNPQGESKEIIKSIKTYSDNLDKKYGKHSDYKVSGEWNNWGE